MLYLKKNQTNNFSVTVNQSATLNTPYYLFSFRHIISNEIVNFIPLVVTSTTRYIEFQFIEAGNEDLSLRPPIVTFPYEGQYYYQIYEQSNSASTSPSNTCIIEEGRAYVEWVNNADETAVYYVQWQSDDENNENWIFISDIEVPPTPTMTPTATVTPSPTSSPVPPTSTPTPSVTPTLTNTPTPSVTPTLTSSPTPSVTPTLTPTPSSSPAPLIDYLITEGSEDILTEDSYLIEIE